MHQLRRFWRGAAVSILHPSPAGHPLDDIARAIYRRAIYEDRCGELFECLLSEGSATIDGKTGQLVLLSGDQVGGLA